MYDDNNNSDRNVKIDERGNKRFYGDMPKQDNEGACRISLRVGDCVKIGDAKIYVARIRKNYDAMLCIIADKGVPISRE